MLEITNFDRGIQRTGKISRKNTQWIDATNITPEEADELARAFDLHSLTKEDIVQEHSRIKLEEFPNYLFCVFYGINEKFQSYEIDLILGKKFIISSHKGEMFSSLKKDKRLELLFKKGTPFIFHKLIDTVIDDYFPVLEKFDDVIEKTEVKVIKSPHAKQLTEILKLKRQLVHIKKLAFQQREKLSNLSKGDYALIPGSLKPYLRDIYDNSVRVSDALDNQREAISEAFDAYMSAVNNNMNEVMKVLSIIATISLPMTVISGIYGTNFRTLPGSGQPLGFWFMLLAMVSVCMVLIYFFRKRGWF